MPLSPAQYRGSDYAHHTDRTAAPLAMPVLHRCHFSRPSSLQRRSALPCYKSGPSLIQVCAGSEHWKTIDYQGLPAKPAGMRHWLLRVALVLAAVLDNRTPMSSAMPTSHSEIESLVRVVSQRQQRGPQAVLPSPADGRLSPSINPSAMGKRSRIRIQELSPSLLLHYYVFTVSITEYEIPVGQDILLGEQQRHLLILHPL